MDNILDPRTHLPQYYKDIREIDIIAEAMVYVLSNIKQEYQRILNNRFIQLADATRIASLERILGLASDPTLDLETRRQKVLSKMATSSIFTLRVLKTSLKEMCDNGEYELSLDYDNFFMDLKVRVGKKGMLDVIYDMLYTMLPAHAGFYMHNHLPAVSEGGTFFAAATRLKHVYRVVDGVAPKGSTRLALSPSGAMSIRINKNVLDAIVDTVNSAMELSPGAVASVRHHKEATDGHTQKLTTEQTLRPALAVASARVIKK